MEEQFLDNIHSELVLVTPEVAQDWLTRMTYTFQRSIRNYHVDELEKAMLKQEFPQGTQIKIGVWEDNEYLLNGQHRLWAVIRSGMPQYFSVLRIRYETKEQVSWAYTQEDIGLKRTAHDTHRALELDKATGLTTTDIAKLDHCVSFLASRCMGQRSLRDTLLDRSDKPEIIILYAPFMHQYKAAIWEPSPGINKTLVRASTLTVALLTYRFSTKKYGIEMIDEFWKGVAHDDGIAKGDPRKFAIHHLRTVKQGTNSASLTQMGSAAASARYMAACFISYTNGDTDRRNIRSVLANQPFELPGIPDDVSEWLV